MVKTAVKGFAVGRTGDFTIAFGSFDHQVIAPGCFSRDAQRLQRSQYNPGGDGFIVLGFTRHESKAGIAEIVEYRAAAAAAAGQAHVIFFHPAGVALFPRVLRPANNHRVGIAPQKQHALGGGHLAENTLFNREVEPGIRRI